MHCIFGCGEQEGGGSVNDVISRIENWSKLSNRIFYDEYIKLLKSVAKELNTNISTIEMLLFAKAEVLVNELQKK